MMQSTPMIVPPSDLDTRDQIVQNDGGRHSTSASSPHSEKVDVLRSRRWRLIRHQHRTGVAENRGQHERARGWDADEQEGHKEDQKRDHTFMVPLPA